MNLVDNQVKITEIAQNYISIEDETECLINMRRLEPNRKMPIMKSNPEINDPHLLKSLVKTYIQFTYLLYTCFMRKKNIYVSKHIYLQKKDSHFEAIRFYLLQAEYKRFSDRQKIEEQMKFYQPSTKTLSFSESVIEELKLFLQLVQKYKKDQFETKQLKQTLKYLQQGISSKLSVPKVVMMSLEQTQMFRQYSVILNIMNKSFYYNLKSSPHRREIFKQIYGFQKLLKQSLTQEVQEIAEKYDKKSVYQQVIRGFAKLLQNSGVIKNQQIEKEGKFYLSFKQKPYTAITQSTIRQIAKKNGVKVQQEVYFQQSLQHKFDKVQPSQTLCQISLQNNVAAIQIKSNIRPTAESQSLLYFHTNAISMGWNDVKMDFNISGKQKEDFVRFLYKMPLNSDNPLIKLIVGIDSVMMCSKIIQPEIKKLTYPQPDKSRECERKIDHLMQFFIMKIHKAYITMLKQQEKYL